MATDLTSKTPSDSDGVVALNANSVAFELVLPRWANKIILQPDTDDIRVGYSGVDGSALTGGKLHKGDFTVEYDIVKRRTNDFGAGALPKPRMFLQTAAQPTNVNYSLLK